MRTRRGCADLHDSRLNASSHGVLFRNGGAQGEETNRRHEDRRAAWLIQVSKDTSYVR